MISNETPYADFAVCLADCIRHGMSEQAPLYVQYPRPTEKEWAQCLKEVKEIGEDLNNPFECMARWEAMVSEGRSHVPIDD